MSKYQELIDAGAPELPEGYYYLIHPPLFNSQRQAFIDVEVFDGVAGVWRSRYTVESSDRYSPGIEHVVSACTGAYNKWMNSVRLEDNINTYRYFSNEKLAP